MQHKNKYREIKKILGEVSPTFCPAKWMQLTLHLHNAQNHSCHHPDTHAIPLDLAQDDCFILHNTPFKMQVRKELLDGIRTSECRYCWDIEQISSEMISDRLIKASDDWCKLDIEKIKANPLDSKTAPRYLEVSFSNFCNLRCLYCYPHISSSILKDYQRYGEYHATESLSSLEKKGKIISKELSQKALKIFWKFLPQIISQLKVLRITGGEPLLHSSTYRLMRDHLTHLPHDSVFSVNSNFSVPTRVIDKFIELVNAHPHPAIELYVSVDTYGKQAEYIRFGLCYSELLLNLRKYLSETRRPITIMTTFSLLSVPSFEYFLNDIQDLKKFGLDLGIANPVTLDISILKNPHFLDYRLLPDHFDEVLSQLTLTMKNSKYFSDYELSKFQRVQNYFRSTKLDKIERDTFQKDFYHFIIQCDYRKGTSFIDTFPQLSSFFSDLRKTHGQETK